MRVAMVAACPFPSPQGSQVFVRDMCRGLCERGHDVHLLTYGQGEDAGIDGVTHERIRRLPGDDALRSGPTLVKPLLDFMLIARLAAMLRRRRFDVVHCHNYEAAMIGLAARVRYAVPVVYHSHNLLGDELPSYFTGTLTRTLAGIGGGALDRSVPRAVDQAIALCDYTAGELSQLGVAADRLNVIPPAVDDPGLCGDRLAARLELGLGGGVPVVTYAGNLDAYQNLPLLAVAFRLLLERHQGEPPVLVVATHGSELEFRVLAHAAGIAEQVRVVSSSEFEPVWRAIEAADAVVMPRRLGSGFPLKLVNYLAGGRAVVTAGCGGKIIRDGVDGLVVGDDDPDDLASALGRLLIDRQLAGALEHEARRTFLSSLTWNAVLPAIEGVYDRATDGRSRGYRAGAV